MNNYSFNLNTFKYPPTETSTLTELERIAIERLQLYKIMEEATKHLHLKENSKKWESYVETKIRQKKLRTYLVLLNTEENVVGLWNARRNNHIAHWLLSLRYCRESTLRHFFMRCELYWFIMLYKRTKKADLDEFLKRNKFTHELVTAHEKEALKDKLLACTSMNVFTFNQELYYKVRFDEVINLVKDRKVLLYNGFAYFPERDLIHYVTNKLWGQFNSQCDWTQEMLSTCDREDRVHHQLAGIPLVRPIIEHNSVLGIKVALEDVDEIADQHYPLCMKTIHRVLREKHHLKYDCKMQYGLFLKSMGLEYHDALEFWRMEFTKAMTKDIYNRKYEYLFKHQYGKVGGRIHYEGYSCDAICGMTPGPLQHHGCPFKHWDKKRLVEKYLATDVPSNRIREIEELVDHQKFKEACTTYFRVTRRVFRGGAFQSPNEYVKDSFETEAAIDYYLDALFDSCETDNY